MLKLEHEGWVLQWIEPYIKTLDVSSITTVLPLVMQFLCEGLQHEMYESVRPNAMHIAAKVSGLNRDFAHN